jgi:cell wall assembly regulator SMI1
MRREWLQYLLADLEAALREVEAPVVDFLRPGLSDEEMDRLCQSHGLVLPGELRAWWGWHNGTDIAAARERTPRGRGAGLAILAYQPSLEEALDYRVTLMAEAQATSPQVALEQYWRPSYLPLTLGSNHTWIADLGAGDAVRVRRMDFLSAHAVVLAPSLANLVERWVAALRGGHMRFDTESHNGWYIEETGLTVPERQQLNDLL